MKKRLAAILVATTVLGTVPCVLAADQTTVTVDGEKVNSEDQQPANIDGRIMVPVRDVAGKMGWEVEWLTYYGDTVVGDILQIEHSAIFTEPIVSTNRYTAGYHSSLNIEDKTKIRSAWGVTHILTQGEDLLVSAPAKIINDRTLVGIRDSADCMYADAQWDAETKIVAIETTPTEQLPQYNEIPANVVSVENQEQQEMPETKPILTIEKEQRQRTEKYTAEQNIKCNESAEEVIGRINQEREKNGLNKLQTNDASMEAADVRVKEIITNFSHTRLDGRKVKTTADKAGFEGNYTGENIIGFVNTLKRAVDNWTESDGHRENYLNPEYTYIDVAYLYDKDSEYGSYWVQIFAR